MNFFSFHTNLIRVILDQMASLWGGSDLGQQVDTLVAPAEGKPQDWAAAVRHGRRLQLQHQVRAVRLSWRRLSVRLGTDHVKRLMGKVITERIDFWIMTHHKTLQKTKRWVRLYLDLLEEFRHLVEVEARVDGTVNTLHGQRLVRSQSFQVGEVWFCLRSN